MPIEVKPLPNCFAAEVTGADMNQWGDDKQFETVHRAFISHGVIVVRDQDLTPDAQIAFGRRFGELQEHVLAKFLLPQHPEILVLSNRRENGEPIGIADAGRHWHSDMSYAERPPLGSMLYAHEIPPVGGETLFVDMHAVYDALPEDTRLRIDGLKGLYNYTRDYEKARKKSPDRPPLSEAQMAALPEVTHPMVRTHPDTGRKALYVNRAFTTGIEELESDESAAILTMLLEHAEKVEFQIRFRWEKNDMAFWDNRCAMHRALWDYWPADRKGNRVTIKGDRPV